MSRHATGHRFRRRTKKAPVFTQPDTSVARHTLLRFSADEPLIVPPVLYSLLALCPDLVDVMDRVRASQPLPTEDKV